MFTFPAAADFISIVVSTSWYCYFADCFMHTALIPLQPHTKVVSFMARGKKSRVFILWTSFDHTLLLTALDQM